MDFGTLCEALRATVSTDGAARAEAERALQQHRYASGQAVTLLQVVAHVQTDWAVRQAAAIQLKQLVDHAWAPQQEGSATLPEEDKQVLRANLIETMVHAHQLVRSQLGEAFKAAAEADHPHNWPGLVDVLKANVVSREYARMTAGLYGLRLLARKYEFKDDNERAPLEHIANDCMPILLQLVEHLNSEGCEDTQAAELMKLSLKTFWSSTYLQLPQHLARDEVFHSWLAVLHKLLLRTVPTQHQPTDPDERRKWPWWKLKKWTLHVINRIFTRYGDPSSMRDTQAHKQERQLAQRFEREYAPQFIEAYISMLSSFAQGAWLPERVLNLVLQNLRHCLSKRVLYKHIKPHMNMILYQVIFPLLCFNDQDEELWLEDPHEYIRRSYDVMEEMYSARTSAINFLHEIARTRRKGNLDGWLNHVNTVFQQYKQGSLQQHYPNYKPDRLLDGALCSVGALATNLKRSKKYSGSIEPLLLQHVLPNFASVSGHVRAKACWVSGYLADADFSDNRAFKQLFQAVVQALNDSELPVRVDALVALRSYVEEVDDVNELKPIIEQVMKELFNLLHEVDTEDIIFTLEAIVEKFGEEISPFALQLLEQLVSAFWKLIQSEDEHDTESEMGALASVGCLRAMSTIMDSVSSLPNLFPDIEKRIFPIFQYMLNERGQDIYEELMELLAYLTYYSPVLSESLWSLWEPLVQQGCTWASAYLESAIIPIDNFITRGTETFLRSKQPNCLAQAFELCKRTLTNNELDADEQLPGARIPCAILQTCTGRVDIWIESYVMLALDFLYHAESKKLKDALMMIFVNAVLYNALLTMQLLQNKSRHQEAFSTWSTFLSERNPAGKRKHFKRESDKKVNALALLALLRIPRESTPQEVESNIGSVFGMATSVLNDYKQQADEREAANQNEEHFVDEDELENELVEEVDDLDEDDEEEGASANVTGSNDPKASIGSALGDLHSTATKDLFDSAEDNDDEDDDGDFFDDVDDDNVETPVDKIDAYKIFRETIDHIAHVDSDRLNRMRSALSAEQASVVDGLYQHAGKGSSHG